MLPPVRGGRVQAGVGDAAAVQDVRVDSRARGGVWCETRHGVWDGGERREEWEWLVLHWELSVCVRFGAV